MQLSLGKPDLHLDNQNLFVNNGFYHELNNYCYALHCTEP